MSRGWQHKMRAIGKCMECGRRRAAKDRVRCRECLEDNNARTKRYQRVGKVLKFRMLTEAEVDELQRQYRLQHLVPAGDL